uniref:Uncharacterized protein n=1 Tax=Romanomermis culicivorax TaxID=13658 RepID=A0A915HM09_ROMCU
MLFSTKNCTKFFFEALVDSYRNCVLNAIKASNATKASNAIKAINATKASNVIKP